MKKKLSLFDRKVDFVLHSDKKLKMEKWFEVFWDSLVWLFEVQNYSITTPNYSKLLQIISGYPNFETNSSFKI